MSFFDATNSIGNFNTSHGDGFIIHFVHVATRDTAHFKAFLTSWEDQVKQNWKPYETVGRMDPIMIYSRTGRQINFSIEIPSASEEEALLNMVQIERMIRMSYPTFDNAVESQETGTQVLVSEQDAEKNKEKQITDKAREIFETNNTSTTYEEVEAIEKNEKGESLEAGKEQILQSFRAALEEATEEVNKSSQAEDYVSNFTRGVITEPVKSITREVTFFSRTASTMVSPPLMRMKFANWSSDTNIDRQYSTSADNSTSGPGGESGAGLYGVIENVKFAPDLSENGGFYACKAFGEDGKSYLIPKLLRLDIVFTVLHASDLGYNSSTRKLRTPGFPYNAENIYKNYQKRKVDIENQKNEILVESELNAQIEQAINSRLTLPGDIGKLINDDQVKKFNESLQTTKRDQKNKTTIQEDLQAKKEREFQNFLTNNRTAEELESQTSRGILLRSPLRDAAGENTTIFAPRSTQSTNTEQNIPTTTPSGAELRRAPPDSAAGVAARIFANSRPPSNTETGLRIGPRNQSTGE